MSACACWGADVGGHVLLAQVQLGEDLVGGVAPPGAVAGQLPGPAHPLGRGEEDADVVRGAHRLGVEVESPSTSTKRLGPDVLGEAGASRAVVVDRLQDRLSAPEVAEVLAEDVEVVRARVERRDAELGALRAARSGDSRRR